MPHVREFIADTVVAAGYARKAPDRESPRLGFLSFNDDGPEVVCVPATDIRLILTPAGREHAGELIARHLAPVDAVAIAVLPAHAHECRLLAALFTEVYCVNDLGAHHWVSP